MKTAIKKQLEEYIYKELYKRNNSPNFRADDELSKLLEQYKELNNTNKYRHYEIQIDYLNLIIICITILSVVIALLL
ncbi:hypothetical protein BJG88_08815 [Staphylococcus nepalensis]|uniref:hypothetical protein n=1 Tax=Staphylococcus nepalensis TaxID=214473 RepID=UPI000D58A043|nr:hypothetical protein [Staphylococcus nepalensis]AWI44833.1 hypothetical protein BJG88_08815 [Staphylococcus nepalensis]